MDCLPCNERREARKAKRLATVNKQQIHSVLSSFTTRITELKASILAIPPNGSPEYYLRSARTLVNDVGNILDSSLSNQLDSSERNFLKNSHNSLIQSVRFITARDYQRAATSLATADRLLKVVVNK